MTIAALAVMPPATFMWLVLTCAACWFIGLIIGAVIGWQCK